MLEPQLETEVNSRGLCHSPRLGGVAEIDYTQEPQFRNWPVHKNRGPK